MGRRMLGMGETTIDEVTVRAVKERKGLRRITWRLGLGDGTTVQCRTEGRCSAAELRERARRHRPAKCAQPVGGYRRTCRSPYARGSVPSAGSGTTGM